MRLSATKLSAINYSSGFGDSLYNAAGQVPSLDLNFATTKSLVDSVTGASLVTFTRSSSGTFVDSAGVLQTAATDVPRFDHNPTTGESLGLLVEEQRTNSIRNNTMVGAVAGTPGTLPTNWPFQAGTNGLAVSIVGTGTESGIAYLDWKISGTTTALATADISFERAAALTGQAWTSSVYVKLVSGSLSAVTTTFIRLVEEDASTNFVAGSSGSITLPTTASLGTQRGSFTRTLSGGATTAFVRTNLAVTVSSGATVDFTLRIGLPQLEQGAFATSPILTSGAAVTRNADVASITGSAFSGWYSQSEGTVFADASGVNNISGATRRYCEIRDAAGSERLVLGYSATNNNRFLVVDNIVTVADISTTSLPTAKTAGAYKLNSFQLASNGTLGTEDGVGTVPTPDQMQIGSQDGSTANNFLNGHIRRLTYWGQRLPNNVLQGITQ